MKILSKNEEREQTGKRCPQTKHDELGNKEGKGGIEHFTFLPLQCIGCLDNINTSPLSRPRPKAQYLSAELQKEAPS